MYTVHFIDRARIGKHILSSYPDGETQRPTLPRVRTEPILPVGRGGPRERLRSTASAPVLSLTHTYGSIHPPDTIPSIDIRPYPPDLPVHPDVDLESGFEVLITKRHWWSRQKQGIVPRVPSEVTWRIHKKSQYALFMTILLSSWTNALLVFVPIGITLHFVDSSPIVDFVTNFLAIIPLAGVIAHELAIYRWELIGCL
jgi:hypothetical protein